jgi:hypothetical protein
MKKREMKKKNNLYYSSLRLGLHYSNTYVIFIGKHNEPITWVNDLYEHPLIIFIKLPFDVHQWYASLKTLLEKIQWEKIIVKEK